MYLRNTKTILVLVAMIISGVSAKAQIKEYIQAFIDKDCYLTGEQILVHVSVTDEALNPMGISKVAYVELCDTKQMQAGGLVQLKDGEGWAAISLPGSMHSGNYQMSVYTRYQRNFGQDCYYKRIVSVVNLLNPSEDDDVEFIEGIPETKVDGQAALLSDKSEYSIREKVSIKLPNVEGNAMTLSVVRKDCAYSDNEQNYPEPVFREFSSLNFIPEVDGHIVSAKPAEGKEVNKTQLSLVGKTGMVFDGQIQKDGSVRYYTIGLNGTLPTCLNGYTFEDNPVRMEYQLPYEVVLPESLPTLKVYYDEKELQNRSIGSQIEKSKRDISLGDIVGHDIQFLGVNPDKFYDLDEYTKFKTVREILIEFVAGIRSRSVNKHKQLFTYNSESHEYSKWAALVLLDGMPVYDIDALMDYDARRLKFVQIYNGRFQFGENPCQGVISFISRKGALQDFRLDEGTQMYNYEFPQDRPAFLSPVYEDKSSRNPDFRHTLYFNPEVTGDCEFYTSDLPGTYEIVLQYVDKNRKDQKISSEFIVKK